MIAERPWVWAQVGVALLLLACDGSAGPPPDGSQEVGPHAGDWQGVTSQSKPIVFRVAGNTVTYLRFQYTMSGSGCSIVGKQMRTVSAPIANDAFAITDSYAGYSSTVAGTFASESEATGTFSGSNSSSCSATADATWQASKLPPAPSFDGTWSGQTSEGKDISMIVSNDQIATLTFAYVATSACVPTTTWSGAPAGASPIVAGAADFSRGISPLAMSGQVTFSDAGTASGALDVSYYDASTTPACSAATKPTFTLQRQ